MESLPVLFCPWLFQIPHHRWIVLVSFDRANEQKKPLIGSPKLDGKANLRSGSLTVGLKVLPGYMLPTGLFIVPTLNVLDTPSAIAVLTEAEPIGSARVAVRLLCAKRASGWRVCCCKTWRTQAENAVFGFGHRHAICHRVRASFSEGAESLRDKFSLAPLRGTPRRMS